MATLSAQSKLTGTPIGSSPSVDYGNSNYPPTTTVNTPADAFDGDYSTFYASYERSYTWVGLDLGSRHVISRVGFSPRNDGKGPQRLRLAVIEGANSPDFLDAVPITIITKGDCPVGSMTYQDVDCSRGFRYVRFVGPSDARCNIAELEFYGVEGDGDDSHLFQLTNIPTVVISTVNAEEPQDKVKNITARIKVISDDGATILDEPGSARLRGNASMQFPKKPYRIKFDKKQRVLSDAPAKAKKWTLINNYGDKTLLRNDIAFEVARRLKMEYVPYLRSVDVIFNGEFKGNYQLCDQVEVNSGRVDIDEMEVTDNEGDALTGGYFVEVDAYADQEISWFKTNRGMPVTIKSPDEEEITQQQRRYIVDYFNKLENELWTSTANGSCSYREIFDVESFLKHFLVGEISGNTDTYWSTYMYKRRSNPVVYTGPVWDFDIAFDNDNRTYPLNNIPGFLSQSSRSSAADNMKDFMNRIINRDAKTKPQLRAIWQQAQDQSGLTAASINEYIDSRAALIDESQKLNFMRWNILGEYVHMNPVALNSYRAEVDRVKSYVTQRFDHLWKIIEKYPQSSVAETIADAGQIFSYQGEIALKGWGYGARYEVYDAMGRQLAAGSFDDSIAFSVDASGLCLVRVVAADSSSATRKLAL